MNKKFIAISILMFLITIFGALAAPDPQLSSGLEIAYPKTDHFPKQTLDLHFHMFDDSHIPLTNETTECLFHLYDNSNSHIIKDYLDFSSNGVDFEYEINGSLLNENEYYSYIVQCNTSTLYGYLSNSFQITNNAREPENPMNLVAIVGLGLLIFLFMYFAFNVDKDHFLLKIIFIFLSLIGIMIIPQIIINGVEGSQLNILRISLASFVLFVIYFSVYIFYHWTKKSEVFARLLGK